MTDHNDTPACPWCGADLSSDVDIGYDCHHMLTYACGSTSLDGDIEASEQSPECKDHIIAKLRQHLRAVCEAVSDTKEEHEHLWREQFQKAIDAAQAYLKQSEEKPTTAVYGYCPKCGAPGVSRERQPNGDDVCERGHTYKSAEAVSRPKLKGGK
jgi:thioesterase domain-containing protein